jgi:type IV secretory pathway VirB2 component (pilin)
MYLAANTAAGQPMTIRLAPNPSATEAATRAPTEPIDASPNGGIAKYIGLVGGGLIIVIGIIIIFARSAKSPKSADA